jgi:hypothetical protein
MNSDQLPDELRSLKPEQQLLMHGIQSWALAFGYTITGLIDVLGVIHRGLCQVQQMIASEYVPANAAERLLRELQEMAGQSGKEASHD